MIKITIVEDHTLFREGIKSLLSKNSELRVVSEYANGKDFIDDIHNNESDIVLMDIEMPEMNGIEASRIAKIKKPSLYIIALSMYSDQKYYFDMIKVGVSGFVLKEASTKDLVKAIEDVYAGMGFFSPELLQQAIMGGLDKAKHKSIEKYNLTDREIEVLTLICKGLSNKEISENLFLSPKTVESHKTKILRKTNTKNTASLIIYAVKNQLIEI